MTLEPIFKNGDYIISDASGDMAVVSSVDKKSYYHFSSYYSGMFHVLKDLKAAPYTLQVNYQKFFRPCTEEEKDSMDKIISETI